MHRRGLRPRAIMNLMQELSGFRAKMSIPGDGETDIFEFSRGGKQGGVETPDEFNMLMDDAMDRLVWQWHIADFGFKLDDGSAITHLVWADNVWLVAESPATLQKMVEDLTQAVVSIGLIWKASSLQVMAGGSAAREACPLIAEVAGGTRLEYHQVMSMQFWDR